MTWIPLLGPDGYTFGFTKKSIGACTRDTGYLMGAWGYIAASAAIYFVIYLRLLIADIRLIRALSDGTTVEMVRG